MNNQQQTATPREKLDRLLGSLADWGLVITMNRIAGSKAYVIEVINTETKARADALMSREGRTNEEAAEVAYMTVQRLIHAVEWLPTVKPLPDCGGR